MGSYYSQPEFGGIIKLLTLLLNNEETLRQWPLEDIEREMLTHQWLLKAMLGSPSASKAFGQCLARMCKDDLKLSRKIAKVFLRSIEQAHLDTVRCYLKALKPFLLLDDSLKKLKLEWVFGVPEIISRRLYGEDRSKYGLELIDRIDEEYL